LSDTFNDEFSSGSADLATRGWTCENFSSGATMSRRGEVQFASVSSLASNQYNSTILGSTILIQVGISVSMLLYKTFSSGSYLFGTRMVPHQIGNGSSTFAEGKLWVYHATRSAANPERNAYGTGFYGSASTTGIAQFIYTNNSGTQLWNTTGNTYDQNVLMDTWTCDLRTSGKPFQAAWNDLYARRRFWRDGNDGTTTTAVAAGVMVATGGVQQQGGGNGPCYVAIDWIRRSS
jgi:hypothetical protein